MVLVYAMCGLISVLAEQSVMEMVVIHLHTKLTAYILHTYTVTLIIFRFWTFNLMSHKIESIHIYFTISQASSLWASCHPLHITVHWPWYSVNSAAPRASCSLTEMAQNLAPGLQQPLAGHWTPHHGHRYTSSQPPTPHRPAYIISCIIYCAAYILHIS